MPLELRPYQEDAVSSIFDYFSRRDGNPLIVLPTGSGKSPCQAMFIKRAIDQYPGTRFLCVTHVKELISQNAKTLVKWVPELSMKVGINSAGLGQRDYQSQILFAGVQSIHKKIQKIGHVDLILVDEAHLIPHKGEGMYRKLLEGLMDISPSLKMVGFTATPYRTGSGLLTQGEGKLFSSVCYSADIVQLIDDGYLSELVTHKGEKSYNVKGVKTRGGEFVASDLNRVVESSTEVTKAAIDEVCRDGVDRKAWLVFTSSVAHAEEVLAILRDKGIASALITGETPQHQRDNTINAFKARKLRCIVNVNVLTTGFDAPHVDLIALLRPTKSVGLYVQMIGRGLRLAEGKDDCLVLDFGGNIDRHGPINDVKIPTPPKGSGDAITKACPSCFYEGIPAGSMTCPECGFEFPQREIKISQRSRKDIIARSRRSWVEVTRVDYRRHRKDGKPDSLRVDYWGGLNRICSEWVCMNHDGYARQKADGWLKRRCAALPPEDIETAIAMGESGDLRRPKAILIDTSKKYTEIVSYSFDGVPPGAGAPLSVQKDLDFNFVETDGEKESDEASPG